MPKVTGGAEEFRRNYGVPLDPAYPNMPYGVDGKRSLVAKAVISKDGIRTSFLPTLIDTQLRPEILHAGAVHAAGERAGGNFGGNCEEVAPS